MLAVQIFAQGHTRPFLCKGLQMRRMRGGQARHLVRVQARVASEQWLEQTAGGIATVQFGLERHHHHRGLVLMAEPNSGQRRATATERVTICRG